jgi:hypothetical protein
MTLKPDPTIGLGVLSAALPELEFLLPDLANVAIPALRSCPLGDGIGIGDDALNSKGLVWLARPCLGSVW